MSQPVPIPDVDTETLRSEIRKEYAEVASHPEKGFHFHTGRPLATILGYADDWVDTLPAPVVESFAGTGNPFSLGKLEPGDRVVDIGCGSGFDSLIAARLVGPAGQVVGVDMTPEMLTKARSGATEAGLNQIDFREGYAESLPAPDGWADVVISNGVVNLCPDKAAVFREMYRVLKPGGRIQIADILVQTAVPEDGKQDIALWTGWIAGALLEAELGQVVTAAGFQDFEITWRADVFDGAPQESSAADFGTRGINFRANRPD